MGGTEANDVPMRILMSSKGFLDARENITNLQTLG
jgi:hypothetical protein